MPEIQPKTIDPDFELPNMTAGELKCQREYLGLSPGWLADKLVMGQRRIERMEAGQETIPEALVTLLDEIHDTAKKMVEEHVTAYRRAIKAADGAPALLPTFRTDKISEAAGMEFPSRFYRHVAARISDAAPGAIIIYTDSTGDDE